MKTVVRFAFLLLLLGLAPVAVAARPAALPRAQLAAGPAGDSISVPSHAFAKHLHPANLNYVWNQFSNFLYNTFRSRERMIQLTLIGVVVGLFIMLRRMPGKE